MGRHVFGDWYVVEVTAQTEREAVGEVVRWHGVIEAEPDARLGFHEMRCPPIEWYIENFGQWGRPSSADVDTDAWDAWEQLETVQPSTPVRIAVLDSGIDFVHLRFNGVTIFAQKKFVDDNRSIGDVYGHGTPVAGVITAMLPNPAWYELGSYRVFDEYGSTTYSVLLAALQEAIADGARIINFSGGGIEPSSALGEFLAAQSDVLFVFSAGNSGDPTPEYPARYHDLPNVVSVAAHDQSGALTVFTNTGALLAAPGQYIFTAMSGCNTQPIRICQPAGYGALAGTSFAAPIVSAICAGRMLMHPTETAAQVRVDLLAGVDTSGRYTNHLASRGRANFRKVLELP
jgi:subtilisin family serine protease